MGLSDRWTFLEMIVLDTNVVSELMLEEPDADVVRWLDQQAPRSIWTTSITVFEVRFGLARMNSGARKHRLSTQFDNLLNEDIRGRVFHFDTLAAERTAALMAELESVGRGIELRDGMICGIALVRQADVATHNVRHFAATPVSIVNPWSANVA